ncbi:MAG: ABC transporter permease, partial [Candidatus Atribacteria bacterium]|nr:ABC transporter permease [Candidatus Atribacteria bacterium]
MSQNVPLTSSFRQPVRTLFLVLLVGAISFAFVSKAVEYIVVQRETGRLGGYYRSIGSLERSDGNDAGGVSQGANLILKSPYLAYEDRRRVSSGVLQDIWNADVDHIMSDNSSTPAGLLTGVHNSDMWFYGTLSERDLRSAGFGWYSLTFQVDKVLAGYPEDLAAGSELNLHFILAGHEYSIPKIESMQVGQRYLIRGWFDHGTSYSEIQIRPLDDADLWYLPVEAGSDVDLNAPSLAGIKNEIDILNQNQHALFLVGTTDMSALPDMQESSHLFFLVDGRWLNHQDDLDGRRVIVIQREFANVRGLKLGDTISMTLRGLRNPFWGYITGDDRENWRTYPTQQETFEIVGIYDDLVGLNLSIYSTEAYVPNSVLSADVVVPGDILNPQSFSFVLDSSQHQEAFVNQYKEPLAQLGFGLTFVENNGAAFWTGVLPLRRSALAGLLVYGLVLLLALALAVFLYLNQRRKDYAILRALGVSKDQANHQVLLPILLIGAAGIIGGGIPSWKYALEKSAETISTLPTPAGALPSATLSPIYLGLIGMGLLLLLFCFAWAGARILAGKPILDLLGRAVPVRGRQRQVKPVQRTTSSIQPGTLAVSAAMPEEHPLDVMPRVPFSAENQIQRVIKTGPKRGIAEIRALARFGFRQIGRDGLRSLLTTLVALGLVLALGWIQWNMDKNRAE